ncbi:MAG: methylated-DNA/protein-cysteinemethyltransferase [Planctomycetaceae bacterium]|nr:methylated-DNA/protein-cysteinemethyltransferase [Planctomycetaceae bacterium]
MGQRGTGKLAPSPELLKVSVFATPLGYWALLGRDKILYALTVGQPDARTAQSAFADPFDGLAIEQTVSDWYPELRQRLERYAAGDRVKFEDVKLHLPARTPFQQQIIDVTRKLKYGETITYGELAARAERPRAARAVGTVMSSNRFPIIIPCHRVVGAGGGLGGYSAPQGLSLKTQLLELEQR